MTWEETTAFFAKCMPKSVGRTLMSQAEGTVREIRVRANAKVKIATSQGEVACSFEPTQAQVLQMVEALCEHALYARAEEQRQGYVTLRGGHRLGLCGRVLLQGSTVRALREISSFCVRVAGQWRGSADALLPHLVDESGHIRSVLIIGLPGMGKTTMLRDACRCLSESGYRMCVVDERSEIAAMSAGVSQLDVGPNTDVLDGASKEQGMRWMLRGMAPDAIVTDELGDVQDAQAVLEVMQSGVSVLCTLHGRNAQECLQKGALYQLVQNHAFGRYAILSEGSVGKIEAILDERLHPIMEEGVPT